MNPSALENIQAIVNQGLRTGTLIEYLDAHGFAAKVYQIHCEYGIKGISPVLESKLKKLALTDLALETVRQQEIVRLLDCFTTRGVKAIILKGAALAYSYYSEAYLRSRGDTDLMIAKDDKRVVFELFDQSGYSLIFPDDRGHVSHQSTFFKRDPISITHLFDVHWKISNSPLLRDAISYAEAVRNSKMIPRLGNNAFGLNPAYALLHSCIHRAGHRHSPYYVNGIKYYEGNRLIWLYDIYLLVSGMQADERNNFARLAKEKCMAGICQDALQNSHKVFLIEDIDPLCDKLATRETEPSTCYLGNSTLAVDFRRFMACQDMSQKLGYIKGLLLPSAAYMRNLYPNSANRSLSFLYIKRIFYQLADRWKRC